VLINDMKVIPAQTCVVLKMLVSKNNLTNINLSSLSYLIPAR